MSDLLDRSDRSDRPSIDPRIARRWIDARREEGRRRLRILSCAGAVVLAGALFLTSFWTPVWKVRHVRVAVAGPVPAAQVEQLAGLAHQKLMVDVDPAAIRAHLDADPVLGGATAARHWPATVAVSVVVRSPVAVVALAGARSWAELDRSGRVLAVVAARPADVPALVGVGVVPAVGGWLAGSPGASAGPAGPVAGTPVDLQAAADSPDAPGPVATALALVVALPEAVRSTVLTVQAGPHGTVAVVVAPARLPTGTVTFELGDGSQLAAKVTALETMLQSADLGGVTQVDLSVPGRPATVG